jgi:transglutaminase-like putative cysteine protease
MWKHWSWFAASVLLAVFATGAQAATVLERTVSIDIQADGSVVERERLRVRLDTDRDLESWSPYVIYLDVNRELESVSASVTRPDGRTESVARRAQDTHEIVAPGEVHSSRKLRSLTFPVAPAGSVLAIEYQVKERPWFPAGEVYLGSSSATESLRVEVKGGGAGWRWRLDGPVSGKAPGLETRETPGGVEIVGRSLPRLSPPDLAPSETGAVLRYGWGEGGTWEAVGGWYERLVAGVPMGAAPVRDRAREIAGSLPGRREKLEALLDFVRRQVRYVAVEVGIGGYRPHTPQEVLERRWGDCKDKAFLLMDLLRDSGIEAWLVLIRFDPDGRVDREFPSPQFNHAIVAVRAEGLGLKEGDPVSGGYLFLDPTQELGALSWLSPGTQDQEALVVRDGKGELVRTPVLPDVESRQASVNVSLSAGGEAAGAARLEITGTAGEAYLGVLRTSRPEEAERVVLNTFGGLLAGVRLDQPKLEADGSAVPSAVLTARVSQVAPEPYQKGAFPQVPVPALAGLPAPGLLDGRELPLVTRPFVNRITWTVELPEDGCPPASGQDVAVENDLGSFRQSLKVEGRRLVLERRTELRRRWIEPAAFPALKELSLAELRASKRRLRLECQ